MRLEREKNARRNLYAGIIQRVVSLALPFVLRTVIIYSLGATYVGINTLFGSVLSVLSLAELGFGSAVIYSMYDPLAKNDHIKVCQLLNYYRRCYRIIGFVILGLGLLLTPLIPTLINSEIPENINIYVVYLITLSSTFFSYYVFAYKSSLLVALQRNDISSWIMTIIIVLRDGIQICIILLFKDYYAFLFVNPIMTILYGFTVEIITRRKFAEYKPSGILDKESTEVIKKKVKSLFLFKIGNVVFNSVDNIVISAFLGLTTLAIYGNYYYVISMLFGFLAVYYDSIRAGIGNKIALETKEKVYELYKQLFFFQSMLIGWMAICLVCLYQDFITLWLNDEKYMFDNRMVILLAVYFYSWKIHDIACVFKEAAGMWEYDRFIPLISSLCNLIINIVLVQLIGIYGVVLSTIICSLVFPLCWQNKILYKYYFQIEYKIYIKQLICYSLISTIIGTLTFFMCNCIHYHSVLSSLIIKGVICCVIPAIMYSVIYKHNKLFLESVSKIRKTIR